MRDVVFRCYVEKRPGFDITAKAVQAEVKGILGLRDIDIRIFNRYDVQNLPGDKWPDVMNTVLNEPMCDICHEERLPALSSGARLLCIEPLPGQFDARSDSCEQCVQMLLGGERPIVRTARVYVI